jgi:hypothetical protein
VLLAGYTPALAFLTRDDSWLFPLAVAAMVGYVIIVDDYLRRRAATAAAESNPVVSADSVPDTNQGRPEDGPGSLMSDQSMDQRPDR